MATASLSVRERIAGASKRIARVKLVVRGATGDITFGGIFIILSVLFIFVFIFGQAVPLFRGATAERLSTLSLAAPGEGESHGAPLVQRPTISYEDRVKIVDLGLDAGKLAVEVKPDYMEAMVYINLLYREKVKLTLDPKEKEQFTKMADEWRQKALDLREKQKKAPKPAGA